jgi:N-acetylneuraminic acid mutarotase
MNKIDVFTISLLRILNTVGNRSRLFIALPLIVFGGAGATMLVADLGAGTPRSLSMADCVAYQRRVEEVYWRHRTVTPGQPRVAFAEAVPESAIRVKVEDTLRKSTALAELWQRPITSAQLQAEMARMAAHTRQPDVLRELFGALDDDPYAIAECLARPLLVERELQGWYARDERLHGALRGRVAAELQARASAPLNTLSGKYSERQLVKQAAVAQTEKSEVGADNKAVVLSENEWQRRLSHLEQAFADAPAGTSNPVWGRTMDRARIPMPGSFPIGRASSLQESDTEFYVVSVLAASANQLTLAAISWPKEPLDVWWQKVRNDFPLANAAASAKPYQLPKIDSASPGVDNTWQPTAAPLSARENHTAVWTGSEMIIWGGFFNPSNYTDYAVTVAGRYNPATDSWHSSNITNAPTWREQHTAIWTGTEMIVWGGYIASSGETNTGARYNPATNTWTPTSTTNAPQARSRHNAVWTGSRMIVWGGRNGSGNDVNTGGIYDPASDTWTATTTSNAPAGRELHTAVWTGSEMIVWGGYDSMSQTVFNTGGRYNSQTNSWQQTTTSGAPAARLAHSSVWTGSRMIVWAGTDLSSDFNNGALYDPAANTWTPMATAGAPTPRSGAVSVWTSSEMIVWGGFGGNNRLRSGGRYNPQTNTWQSISTVGAPEGAVLMSVVWTGTEMIVWGGQEPTIASDVNTGARYNPQNDSWLPVTNPQNGGPRNEHPAVWTGSEMIVWGSYTLMTTTTNTGARYYPATDSWLPTSMNNVPSTRYAPLAVWTGSQMIVWGGCGDPFCFTRLNTGGRYNPVTDSWQPTSTTGAAESRYWFSMVWTGTEMIVWGGCDAQTCGPGGGSDPNGLNNGGRYNPQTDTWQLLTTAGAPPSRWNQTAVWSGNDMIVWGGVKGAGPVDTGGRYHPATDTWTPTSTVNAPIARDLPRSVWTGTRMIVWGGYNSLLDQYFNTGGLYNPDGDTWTATTLTGAPSPRVGHSLVWTGSEMIAWGGCNGVNCLNGLNTGGRYNPQTDAWQTTTTTEAPSSRVTHSAVWTGSEMIVFGGAPCARCEPVFDTGGRYTAAGQITLSARGKKVNGINTVRLTWTGANSANIDVYRNGVVVATTPNDGSYDDSTGDTGRAHYVYMVCEAGTQTCSNEVIVNFRR